MRRELLRAKKDAGLARLDEVTANLGLEPIITTAMREAARLWADVRRRGLLTAPDLALDGDVILAAQALGLAALEGDVVVATTNPKHLERFIPAHPWSEV